MSNNPRVDKGNSRNFFIDAYRMFLILCIMLFHFTYTYNTKDPSIQISYPFVFRNGHIGVSQFFIISGYYMSRLLVEPCFVCSSWHKLFGWRSPVYRDAVYNGTYYRWMCFDNKYSEKNESPAGR